jgi:two-component system response regulator AlgR
MRIVIADDEKLARARLRELISKIGDHTVVGEAVNGSEAVERSLELKPTVLLLDIRMPVMDGLEAAMHVMSMENPPAVIFTTAYDQHALEAFEVNAVDYLLKPIRKDRLAAALQKARRTSMRQLRQLNQSQDEPAARTHISVHMRGQISLIPAQDIIYFMADSKYVTVRTSTEQHLIEDSLISLEEEFGDHFLRIHRNALVAVNYIRGIEKQPSGRWSVLLKSIDDKLDVSRRHTPAVRRWTRR